MRYGLISDIHGNLEALETVLAELHNLEVDAILCLGDVVGYGPNPDECVKLVQAHAAICLMGNHDEASLGDTDLSFFNYVAREAIEWTGEHLNPDSKNFLRALPYTYEFENYLFVHASPNEPHEWNYITSWEGAEQSFQAFHQQACFVGHSHSPLVVGRNEHGAMQLHQNYPILFENNHRYLINIGSVGQPRDSNPAAAYGILDTAQKEYTLLRLGYDVAKTQKKIRAAGLPGFLADRLAEGR